MSSEVITLTLDEAIKEREILVQRLMDLQDKVSDRNLTVNGKRLSSREYWKWRDSAGREMRQLQRRCSDLKAYIRSLRHSETVAALNLTDTSDLGLLRALYEVVEGFDPDDFDNKEKEVIRLVRNRVHGFKPTNGVTNVRNS